MKQEVLANARGMEFWTYLAKNVPAHYQWGVKMSLDDLISWGKVAGWSRRSSTSRSCVCRSRSITSRSPYSGVRLGSLGILRVCGDEVEQATIKQKEKAKYTVCKILMENSFRIKDEIMLLCIKQIRKNKRKLSAESAWGMLACMLSLSSPSEGLSTR
jgi:hypothetical protein